MSRDPEDLLAFNPDTGKKTWWHYDPVTGSAVIETEQEVSDITEDNLRLRNCYDERARWTQFSNHVASIPDFLFHRLRKQFGDDQKAWAKWLNDPDNRAFRTRPGRI